MSWKEKLDSFWKGFAIGTLFPVFVFFCYWLFIYSYMGFPVRFVKYLIFGNVLSATVKMCALGNLLIFYFFLNSKLNSGTKGIIASVFVYLALIVYTMFFVEK